MSLKPPLMRGYRNRMGRRNSKTNEAEAGKSDRYKVTWKNQTRKAYSVEEKSFRTLRVKKIKEEG